MQKLMMIAMIAVLPAVASFGHCGKCGPDHKHEDKKECCGKDGACCKKKACCGKDGACCKKKECCGKCKGDSAAAATSVQYTVAGITCGGCEGKLTKALSGMKGVSVAPMCKSSQTAKVTVDSSKVKAADVEAAIVATGFKVK